MAYQTSTAKHDLHHSQERRQELVAAWIQAQITRGEEIQRRESEQLRVSETPQSRRERQ